MKSIGIPDDVAEILDNDIEDVKMTPPDEIFADLESKNLFLIQYLQETEAQLQAKKSELAKTRRQEDIKQLRLQRDQIYEEQHKMNEEIVKLEK